VSLGQITREHESHCRDRQSAALAGSPDHDIDLARSCDRRSIARRRRDVAAGRAGCSTIFIDYGYKQDGPNFPDHVAKSLPEAEVFILGQD
jgi:hypothetical protein